VGCGVLLWQDLGLGERGQEVDDDDGAEELLRNRIVKCVSVG